MATPFKFCLPIYLSSPDGLYKPARIVFPTVQDETAPMSILRDHVLNVMNQKADTAGWEPFLWLLPSAIFPPKEIPQVSELPTRLPVKTKLVWEEVDFKMFKTDPEGRLVVIFSPASRKRPLDALFELAKKAKLTKLTPSDASKPTTYQDMQHDDLQRVLDDRPSPDLDIPPAALLYSGFGHFIDVLNGSDDVPLLENVDFPALEDAVDNFAAAMNNFFRPRELSSGSRARPPQ
ncbi:hypothetical protein NLJ89_g7119 [Agrocybe chaxingu]|uniref:Uncharacterized protein n=1 Tax=Agrocybe chaxingu TaxID=84603 RepID=A0A9W8MS21_9AGAR|nr:hypothetical protein NLJ89_g7119 [Agrocybe chaxingu]